MPKLEIACFNSTSIRAAARAGAERIEFCADYASGGVTPSTEGLPSLDQIGIPINIMIRPRAGDFVYSETEYEKMKSDIELLKPLASGFVFGILDTSNRVDAQRNQELVELAKPWPCTFHRAFDQTPDLLEAAEQLVHCGFRSILTSGAQPSASIGVGAVVELQERFGDQVSFILGGGVRSTNVESLKSKGAIQWYHSAAIVGEGEDVDENEVRLLKTLLSSME